MGYEPKSVKIGRRAVGPGRPVYIVAEIGINHNGDMKLAKKTIDAAAAAGADAVKFQNYFTEDFISGRKLKYTYRSRGKKITESQYDMFKRCELSSDDLAGLAAHCRKRGIDMHSTPTSQRGIDGLLKARVGVLKNGSDYLPNVDLIRAMGKTGLPTVLSTGMAEIDEIDEAVKAFRSTGNKDLILLHCTSSYPTPDEDVNVCRVKTLQDTFGCLAGFSDHSHGISAAVLSVVYGACWIEKHFTFSRNLPGPDHAFSMDPAELAQLVGTVRAAEKQIGLPVLGPTKAEARGRREYRLSCVAAEGLAAGTVLSPEHIAFRRPGTGVKPAQADLLCGRKLKKSVSKGHVFDARKDFE